MSKGEFQPSERRERIQKRIDQEWPNEELTEKVKVTPEEAVAAQAQGYGGDAYFEMRIERLKRDKAEKRITKEEGL